MLWGGVKNSVSFADLWASFRAVSVSNGSGHESIEAQHQHRATPGLRSWKVGPKEYSSCHDLEFEGSHD